MESTPNVPFPFVDEAAEFSAALAADIRTEYDAQRNEILPVENDLIYCHGKRFHTTTDPDHPDDPVGEMQTHSAEVTIRYQPIVDNDPEALRSHCTAIVGRMMEAFHRALYQTARESTERSGNIVSTDGAPLRPEHLLEVLDKLELSVNRQGEISLPEIHTSPGIAAALQRQIANQGPDFQRKLDDIFNRKATDALAREQARLARFHPPEEDWP